MYYDIKESGKRLSELRKMKGLTQQQVADELGMDVDTVRKNEQGRRGLSIDAAGIYAEYYHTMQLNLLPVARKMVLEELEMKQNG